MRTLTLLFGVLLTACGNEAQTPSPELETAAPQAEAERASLGETIAQQAMAEDLALASGAREVKWEDLMPEGEEERLAQLYQQQMASLYGGAPVEEGSSADTMTQIGTFNTVAELDGQTVRIPGYTVPFDFTADAQITEFLLVPYFGACIHAPPPPPNQTLYVTTDTPIRIQDLAQAVWIEGTLHTQTQESELADAAYTFTLERMEVYEY